MTSKKIHLLLFFILFLFSNTLIIFSQVPTNGLVAYYPFNGNANDYTGGNNLFNFGASLTTDRFGNLNQSYLFNGTNNYLKGSSSNLPSTSRTVSLWFYTTSLTTKPCLLGYGGGIVNGSSFEMGINVTGLSSGGDQTFMVQSHNNVNLLYYIYSQPPINKWYHWAITTTNGNTSMYIDGIKVAINSNYINNTDTFGKDFCLGVTVSPQGLGPYTDINSGYFFGKLDDIRLYNRALSENEVKLLYHENGWQQFTISTSSNPLMGGMTSGGGFYNYGTNVLVVATPNQGYMFVNWTENGIVISTNPSYQFTVTSNRNLIANFITIPTLSVSPLYIGVNATAGVGQFSVSNTTGGTMPWTAVSNANWIAITGGNNGINNGSINISYQANQTSQQRTGSITVTAPIAFNSPQTVEVRQDKIVSVDEHSIPIQFALHQNFPNPFNPSTTISFDLPTAEFVQLKIYDMLGREIKTLVNEFKQAGRYSITFTTDELSSGMFLCQMKALNFHSTKKIILLR